MDGGNSQVIARLRTSKAQLRRARFNAPLEEKVQNLLRLQRVYVDIARSQRMLPPWQRPWTITSRVDDSVLVQVYSVTSYLPSAFSASRPQWILPSRRVALRT